MPRPQPITNDHLASMFKASAWERAKGALRETVAIEGSKTGGQWEKLDEAVKDFIDHFESEGFHE